MYNYMNKEGWNGSPKGDTYVAYLVLRRSVAEDRQIVEEKYGCFNAEVCAKQIAAEFQQAYDDHGIAGEFNVYSVGIDSVIPVSETMDPAAAMQIVMGLAKKGGRFTPAEAIALRIAEDFIVNQMGDD